MKIIFSERLKRDWFIIFLLLLVGVCFMFIAGQQAIQIVSDWSLNTNMRSNLDPNARFRIESRSVDNMEPLKAEILTPPVWNDTFLTPMADNDAVETAVTMVVFDPSTAPLAVPDSSPTPSPPESPTPSPPESTSEPDPTVVESPSPTPVVPVKVKAKKEALDEDADPPPPPPPPPSPSPPPQPSTIDTSEYSQVQVPANLDVGSPDNYKANITKGTYVVIDVTEGCTKPKLNVEGPAETNYDLVYYESESGGNITLDHVIIGISNEPDGDPYYEVFNWGDNVPDTNTNVDISIMPPDPSALPPPGPACTEAECDNRKISTDKLYDPSGSPGEPQTGILIDVDNAPSNPPPGEYEYVVIISPNSGDSSNQIDGIELVDEPPPP